MRKPTRKEALFGLGGSLLSCAALVLAGSLLLGGERQKTADAVATNQILAAAAIQLSAEIAAEPAATDTELPPYLIPTGTPSPTLIATETLAPTQTSTATLTLFPTATPGLRECQVSAYEACDNNIGVNAGGAAQAVFARLIDHLTSALEQLARYGNSARRQDYAADMLFSPVKEGSTGQVELTWQRGPDFWEKHGGLGFNPDNYNRHDGVQAALAARPDEFFRLGTDGIYRAIVEIQEQEDFEFGLAAAARAKFKILYPDLDFTKPEVLRAFDDLIRSEVQSAVKENGFWPKTAEPWPGAEKIFGFEYVSFVDGEGEVCIGSRPAAAQRNKQVPERFIQTEYIRGLEDENPWNDEEFDRLDTRGSVMVSLAFDKNHRRLRADIFTLSSPPDPSRTEAEPLDSEEIDERTRIDRWNPCGPGAPAPEISPTPAPSPLGGPAITETVMPQVTPAETPKPGESPAPTGTPETPPPSPQPTPGAHESTPEGGVSTDVPPGPSEPDPTFVPQPTESMGGQTEIAPTSEY